MSVAGEVLAKGREKVGEGRRNAGVVERVVFARTARAVRYHPAMEAVYVAYHQ